MIVQVGMWSVIGGDMVPAVMSVSASVVSVVSTRLLYCGVGRTLSVWLLWYASCFR